MGLLHFVLAPTDAKRSKWMEKYIKRIKALDEHIAEHPKDYQAVIGRMKAYSDAVEHQMYLKAEFRRAENEESL